MGDHRLPKRIMSGERENAGQRRLGGKEKEWTDIVAEKTRHHCSPEIRRSNGGS